MASEGKSKRRIESGGDDVPYTMRLPDGRTLLVLVPAAWCETDVSGETAFMPEAVRLLDRARVMAMRTPAVPTPGHIRTLREALGMTQTQFGERVGADKMTVWRWEQGRFHPGAEALKGIETLRREAGRKGVLLAG